MSIDDRLRELPETLDSEIPLPLRWQTKLLKAVEGGTSLGMNGAPSGAGDMNTDTVESGGSRGGNGRRGDGGRRGRRIWLGIASTAAAVVIASAAYIALTPSTPALANEVHNLGAQCPIDADLVPLADGDVDQLNGITDKIVKTQYTDSDNSDYDVTMLKPVSGVMVYNDMVANFCGSNVEASTYIMQLHFPALEPSASMSQGQLFVTKTKGGWDVWFKYH